METHAKFVIIGKNENLDYLTKLVATHLLK